MHHTSETHAAANHKARRLADHGGSGTFGGTQAKTFGVNACLSVALFSCFSSDPPPPAVWCATFFHFESVLVGRARR